MRKLTFILVIFLIWVGLIFFNILSSDIYLSYETYIRNYFDLWLGTISSDTQKSNTLFYGTFFFVYTFISGIPFIPLPSEIGILYVNKLGFILPFIASALGKAMVSMGGGLTIQYMLSKKSIEIAKRLRVNNARLYILLQGRLGGLIYFVCQSIPFLPMRSSTAIYAFIAKRDKNVIAYIGFASLVGTVIRMSLLYVLLILGYELFTSLNGS